MLAKYADEERIEQMNAQKKRMKVLEHKRAVEALIQERREREEKERKADQELYIREAELEKYKRNVIEQERRRLLLDHARNLIGFLPKVVLVFQIVFMLNLRRVSFAMKKIWNCLMKSLEETLTRNWR